MKGCKCGNNCEPCTDCFYPLCECACGTMDIDFEEEQYEDHYEDRKKT